MNVGTIYRLPSGQLAECVKVSEHQADFRYINAPRSHTKADEVSLMQAHWAKLVRVTQ